MLRAPWELTVRVVSLAVLLLIGSLASPGYSTAQSIGLEAGLASIESFDGPRPQLGASLFLPLTERFRIVAGVTQWTGCPEGGCVEPRSGYGNRGLNVLGLYRAWGTRRTNLSIGAGMGWFEMKRLGSSERDTETYYDEAFTFAAEARREVAYNSAVYLRGEASVPTDDSEIRWATLRLGVDVRPF